MTFGSSPNDIIPVATLCKALYRRCRDAGGEYEEIGREVRDVHTVLRHLRYEAKDPESPINRDESLWTRKAAPTIGNCDSTLRELDTVLQKYSHVAGSANSSPTSPRAQWDRLRLGNSEMDSLGAIRVKLISYNSTLTAFLDTIQLQQSEQMQQPLDNHGGQLDDILDKVDIIAARMGQMNGTTLKNNDDDDQEIWKQFRKELIAEGFSSDVLMQHKDVLRAYIREIDQKGLLDDTPTQHTTITEGGMNPERWLEPVKSTTMVDSLPPTFSSLNVVANDEGAKEMMVREENMKFPQSIKLAKPKPESEGVLESERSLEVPSQDRRTSSNTSRPRQPSPIPRLITTQAPASEEKEVVPAHHNHTSSSHTDSESESSKQLGLVIKTSDLLAFSRALSPHPGSPLSFRSQSSFAGSYENTDATRSIAQRPKKGPAVEYGSAPIALVPGAIPIPNSSNPRTSAQSFGSSPSQLRSEGSFKLAPDSQGNEISSSAKWTKINRRLVSPEVLDQDHRRYEARPEFVAVLGVLSREEIESYARRSHELRESRRRQHHPPLQPSLAAQAIPRQPQPHSREVPRDIPKSSEASAPRRAHFNPNTSSSSSTSSSSDTSSSDSDTSHSSHSRHRQRRRRPKASRRYPSSKTGIPISGYPNPYGSPPSPVRSPGYTWDSKDSTPARNKSSRSDRDAKPRDRVRDRDVDRDRDGDRDRDRARDREDRGRDRDRDRDDRDKGRDSQRRRRQHHHHHSSSSTASSKSKAPVSEKQQRASRWKENLTAAGIGGAAVSLLNVLSEAAEGL